MSRLFRRLMPVLVAALVGCAAADSDTEEEPAMSDAEQALANAARDSEGCTFTLADDKAVSEPKGPWVQHVAALFDEVRAREFPGLADYDVRFRVGHANDAILRTSMSATSLFRRADRRRYFVIVSDRFVDAHPDDDAIRAILVHELAHIVDYTKLSRLELAEFLASYALSAKRFVPRYERDTDLRTLERTADEGDAVAKGMMAYREWLYANLSSDLVAVKRRNYLSPEEIQRCHDAIVEGNEREAACRIQSRFSAAE